MVVVFDLDDTLYDEVDFVKSGFSEISRYLGSNDYFDFMWREFLENGSGKIFDKLIEKFDLNIDVKKLIEIYRFHNPDISLREDSKDILKTLKKKLSLITDGHYITQQNKFRALGLGEYINYPIFTDFYHTSKLDEKPFLMIMNKFKDDEFVYVADNPKKDFFVPKRLGWKSVRFKNKRGIYKDYPNNADFEIYDLRELKEIL